MYVIVTNHVNWHRENLRLDRENIGILKCNLSGHPVVFCGKVVFNLTCYKDTCSFGQPLKVQIQYLIGDLEFFERPGEVLLYAGWLSPRGMG